MADVRVSITGVDVAQAHVAAIAAAAADLTPFWRDVFAPVYFASVQDRFDREGQTRNAQGQFASGRWAPLSAWYAKQKAVKFPGKGILEATGRLRHSLRWAGTIGPEGIFEPRPDRVTFGTAVPYGADHMTGRAHPPMPARPFLAPPNPATFGPLLHAWLLKVGGAGGTTGGTPPPTP